MNLLNVDYHIVDYCNINCISCGHFCPLAPKGAGELDMPRVIDELKLLYDKSELGSRIDMLTITGGECTLHPYFEEIVRYAYSLFNSKVRIFSNATNIDKLLSISDLTKDRKVGVVVSNYGFNLSEDKIKTLIENGISLYTIDRNNPNWNRAFFSSMPLIQQGRQLHCEARGYCTQYVDRKLYLCQYAAYFKYFDHAFEGQHNLKLDGTEYIDLTKVENFDDIIKFRNETVIPICNRCLDCDPNRPHQQWGISKKNIEEWMI